MAPVGTLLRKEMLDALRDRRTLLMMVVLPLLLYPLMIALVGAVTALGRDQLSKEQLVAAVTSAGAEQLLQQEQPPPRMTLVRMARADAELALRERKVAAIVDAPAEALAAVAAGRQVVVVLGYTKRYDRSLEARERLRRSLAAANVDVLTRRLVEARLPNDFAEPLKTDEVDLDFQKNLGPLIASRTLPIMLLVMLFMSALYPAVDVTAGEKERGTFETLLVAPVRPGQVLLAKFLTVAGVSIFATLMNLVAMGVTFGVGLSLVGGVDTRLSFSSAQLATLLVCLLPASLAASGLSLAVASLGRTFREAQTLLTPITLVATVPGLLAMMPGIELDGVTALIPLLNLALLIKGVALQTVQPLHVALTFASVSLLAAGAVWLASNAFASEGARFGRGTFAGLFGRDRGS